MSAFIPTKPRWKRGDIVRYDSGSTAMFQLLSRHTGTRGGWHGFQCMGGLTFASEDKFSEPTAEDLAMWDSQSQHRQDTYARYATPDSGDADVSGDYRGLAARYGVTNWRDLTYQLLRHIEDLEHHISKA